jgi:hypothetical protein
MKKSVKTIPADLSIKYDRLLLQLLNEDLKNLKSRKSGFMPLYHFQP